jgi:hypothetical protein
LAEIVLIALRAYDLDQDPVSVSVSVAAGGGRQTRSTIRGKHLVA